MTRLDEAKAIYSEMDVDVDKALKTLSGIKISLHCWQGDDVAGFENAGALSGGIAATGNYPGKARNPQELMNDLDLALRLIPGKHKINLHAIYAVTDEKPERNELEPRHFQKWVDFAKARGLGLDFNPTLFSHPKAASGLTLSHPDAPIRKYWVEHCQASRRIAEHIGRELGQPALNNIWIPDGLKDTPGDRLSPRRRLMESLDEIYSYKPDSRYLADSVESKVFGIGVESYTVGSHEFYMSYAARNGLICLLDNGHFHPTENIADKISSLLLFFDRLALHITRPVRWDSDHVVSFNDELKEIAKELALCKALDRVFIGLDYFDASINRVAAWVIGARNFQKALLMALLLPAERMALLQEEGRYTELLALQEELKTFPLGAVWDAFCEEAGVPVRESWMKIVGDYETSVQFKRS